MGLNIKILKTGFKLIGQYQCFLLFLNDCNSVAVLSPVCLSFSVFFLISACLLFTSLLLNVLLLFKPDLSRSST